MDDRFGALDGWEHGAFRVLWRYGGRRHEETKLMPKLSQICDIVVPDINVCVLDSR